jgi:hypothetical protein
LCALKWPKRKPQASLTLHLTFGNTTTKTQTYAGNLPGGSWTRIEFIATPASADDMKAVKLTFDTNTVSLEGGS